MQRVVVISDVHFGDPLEILTDENRIGDLQQFLEETGDIDEIVLLGDIFDFWKCPMPEALGRGRSFMEMLYSLKNVNRLVFVPGNHDHHLFCLELYRRQTKVLRKKRVETPGMEFPLRFSSQAMEALKPSRSSIPLETIYPYYSIELPAGKVLLTHGQLLGFFEKFWWREKRDWVSSVFMKGQVELNLEDIDRAITPYYEMLALSPVVPGLVDGSFWLYGLFDKIGSFLGMIGNVRESARRHTTLEENLPEIQSFIQDFFPYIPDCFVFGHTHKGGSARLDNNRETLILNTGCWIDEPPVRRSSIGVVGVLDDDFRLAQVL